MDEASRNWEARYQSGDLPWDSGLRSRELAQVLGESRIAPCRVVELGCGTGTNAVFLAEQGFEVTALDLSSTAIGQAKQRAESAGVNVVFHVADLLDFDLDLGTFDLMFDRGCFHCARKVDVAGYRETLKKLSRPGTRYLLLTGNARDENLEEGPPKLHEHEIRDDLGELFEFAFIREFHFEDAGEIQGPLGWSCWMTRK